MNKELNEDNEGDEDDETGIDDNPVIDNLSNEFKNDFFAK